MGRGSALKHTDYLNIQSSKAVYGILFNEHDPCHSAIHGPSATWKRVDTTFMSKGNEIRDVSYRQVRERSLRLLEPFIGVGGFDYVITLKFQHFS